MNSRTSLFVVVVLAAATAWPSLAAPPLARLSLAPVGAAKGILIGLNLPTKLGAGVAAPLVPQRGASPLPRLSAAEFDGLRPRLAALFKLQPAQLVSPRAANDLSTPGNSVTIALNSLQGGWQFMNISGSRHVFREANGPGYAEFQGSDVPPGSYHSLGLGCDVKGGMYLWVLHVETNLPTVRASLWQYGGGGGGSFVNVAPANGKLLIPFETGPGAYLTQLFLLFDDTTPKTGHLKFTSAELIKVL